nr:hypothetical protein [Tanacetum cinerariifolium]
MKSGSNSVEDYKVERTTLSFSAPSPAVCRSTVSEVIKVRQDEKVIEEKDDEDFLFFTFAASPVANHNEDLWIVEASERIGIITQLVDIILHNFKEPKDSALSRVGEDNSSRKKIESLSSKKTKEMSKQKPEYVIDAVNGNIEGVCSAYGPGGKERQPQRRAATFCSCRTMLCCSLLVHDTKTTRVRSAKAEVKGRVSLQLLWLTPYELEEGTTKVQAMRAKERDQHVEAVAVVEEETVAAVVVAVEVETVAAVAVAVEVDTVAAVVVEMIASINITKY